MNWIRLVMLVILASLVLFFSPGGFFVTFVTLFIWLRLKKTTSPDNNFILNLFLIAFMTRLFLLLVFSAILVSRNQILAYSNYPGWTPNLIGDASYYTLRSYWIALGWGGYPLSDKILNSAHYPMYGWNGYTYVIAVFHYVFGFSPIASITINCLLGSLNAILAYFIMKSLFTKKVAQLAGIFVGFYPSMILWSVTNLKDTALTFATLFIIWSFIVFIHSQGFKKVLSLILIICGLLIQNTLRIGIMPITLISLSVSYFLNIKSRSAKIKLFFTLIVCFVVFSFVGKLTMEKINNKMHMAVYKLICFHQGGVTAPGSSYKILEDKYYLLNSNYKPQRGDPDTEYYAYPIFKLSYFEYIPIYLRAMGHFMFEPFLWRIDTMLKLFSLPQMIIWYAMLPLALAGVFLSMRYARRGSLILLVYFLLTSASLALTQSNIGTLFRMRDLITPIVLFWASVGMAKMLGWKIKKEINA